MKISIAIIVGFVCLILSIFVTHQIAATFIDHDLRQLVSLVCGFVGGIMSGGIAAGIYLLLEKNDL
jgi:predicted permease